MIFLKSFFKSLIYASFAAMIVGFTIYSRVDGTEVDIKKLVIDPKPTIIYDANNKQMAKFIKERKDVTEFKDMPTEIPQALLATEDRDFYEHVGVNPKAILRAIIHDIKVGSFDQGGSTITQQLVKNIYLTTGKTLERKQKEAIYATVLEGELTKEQILTYYINHADFVYNSYGVRNGIETYFGESLDEFKKSDRIERIAKSALLMGMLQSPTENNPFMYPKSALSRRNVVIHNMYVQKYITKAEYDQAIEKPLLTLDNPKYVHDDEKMYYPEIVSYVLEELRAKYNLDSADQARYVGKKVYTSFDPKVYNIIRKNVENASLYPGEAKDGTQVQASVSIVNPKNGEIIALTGGRQKPGFLEFNRAYQGHFQPGSTLKPIIAYGPALEYNKSYTPWTILPGNSGIGFGGGYVVHNFGNNNYGSISMTQALTLSANVSAVYLLQQTGISRAADFAEKQGIKIEDSDRYLPVALGALTTGVAPLKMADAYQGFANGGYRVPAHIIRKLVSHDGKVEYETPKSLTKDYRTMKAQTAKYMKYMMRNGVLSGTSRNANIDGQFVAGKTGTAELANVKGRNRDIWFTGFTNQYVASVWMGFDSPSKVRSFSNQDTSWIAARMFGEIGKEMIKLYPSKLSSYKEPKKEKQEVKTINLSGNYSVYDNKVVLTWDSVKDSKYKVYRDGSVLGEANGTMFDNITIEPDKTYRYKIEAYDKYTEEKTAESNEITVTTSQPVQEEPTQEETTENQPTDGTTDTTTQDGTTEGEQTTDTTTQDGTTQTEGVTQ